MSAFTPDASVSLDVVPSSNHGERRGVLQPDMLLLHYTGMPDAHDALQRLCAVGSDVSAHYLVVEDGSILQLVPEARRAWHAGVASWGGKDDINSQSIGIEMANPGHDGGYPDYPEQQIAAIIALCRDILARLPIPPERILAHSDVSPQRKQDPGEKFPWAALCAAGIGHWVAPAEDPDGASAILKVGDHGPAVEALCGKLREYGYEVAATDLYDRSVANVVQAFQRHFYPSRTDGLADLATRATLARLCASVGKKSLACDK